MNDSLSKKLEKLGFKNQDAESLLGSLSKDLWVTYGTKNIKRERALYMLKIDGKKYTLFLYSQSETQVGVINNEDGNSLSEVAGKMLLFLDSSELLKPL